MNSNDHNMNPNDLDQQIRAALRVEPSSQQLARLECFWRQQSRAERRRRRVRGAAALAATVFVAVGVSLWFWRKEAPHQPLEANGSPRGVPTAPAPNHAAAFEHAEASEHAAAAPARREERSLSAGRPPTTYERFLFAVHTHKPVGTERASLVATVDEVIEHLTRDPDADAEQLAKSSGLVERDAERLLLRQLLRSGDDRKHAVLQLLAVCGTPRSTPQLLRLSRREAFRDEALAAVERIVGIERLAEVVGQASDRRVRAALICRLLTAESEAALHGYLSLVRHEAMRGEALAVAEDVAQPVLAALLGLLDDEDEAVRISAAVVLGHVNGPEVTNLLISRVTEEPSDSTETWIALLACRGEQAEEFFAYAGCQPRLLVHVNRARVWWARTIPQFF